jgi:hypothetical protein
MEKQVPENLRKRMTDVTDNLKDVISELQRDGLVHTQEALNFIDNINMLSVTF